MKRSFNTRGSSLLKCTTFLGHISLCQSAPPPPCSNRAKACTNKIKMQKCTKKKILWQDSPKPCRRRRSAAPRSGRRTREVALLLGLTGGNRYAAQQLWLRKERIKAEASQFASAGSPQASQQPAGCRAKPATAKAQGVPKRSSPAQLAKKSRRLNQKHLASKMWACVRVASRLLAWCVRARARTCGLREASSRAMLSAAPDCRRRAPRQIRRARGLSRAERGRAATVGDSGWDERLWPAFGPLWRFPILVGRLLLQQWPSRRGAGPSPAPAPLALAAPPPATQLAPSTPPSQQQPNRPVWNGGPLAAAAAPPAPAASRPKRDVPAASPSRAPAHPKKTRGVAVQAALAAAAPPITATNYAAAALAAAANPHPPSA